MKTTGMQIDDLENDAAPQDTSIVWLGPLLVIWAMTQ